MYRRATGGRIHPGEMQTCAFPEEGRYLWEWFWDLNTSRRVQDGSFMALAATEYTSWAAFAGLKLEPWEAAALKALDRVFLDAYAQKVEG